MNYFPEYGQAVHFKKGKRQYTIVESRILNAGLFGNLMEVRIIGKHYNRWIPSERLVSCK